MIITVKCKKCGEGDIPFRNMNGQGKCPICAANVTLKTEYPDIYADLNLKKDEIKTELGKIAAEYKETGSTKDILTCVQSYSSYKDRLCDEDFFELWRAFLLNVAGIAAERGDKKDRELQLQLKAAAKNYDADNPKSGKSLYVDIIRAYPNLGNDNDWNDMIQATHGDKDKFIALSETLIAYIARARDKVFAMDKFYLFNAKQEEWAEAGGIYLRSLFNNEEIAKNVFNVSSFTPKTKKFIRKVQAYCNKNLSGENMLTLSETKVWAEYEAACKRQRKRSIIAVSSVAAAILVTCVSLFAFFNSVDNNYIEFNIDKVIEVTYGEEPSLSSYNVTYKKRSGKTVSEPITMKMISGYDPEKIGTQTVYVQFSGKQTGITIRVNPAPIQMPQLTRSNNSVTWEFVPNATSYELYINNTSAALTTIEGLSYDLSQYEGFGELSVVVRAINPSEKYENSPMSDTLTVTKLQAPQNLLYEKGILTWDNVAGADSYELAINGTPATSATNSISTQLLYGKNNVKIVAKTADGRAVDGVTTQMLYRLSSVNSVSYANNKISWMAEEYANTYDIYVDGEKWHTFTRKEFDLSTDGFTETYDDDRYTIGIVCKSTVLGMQPSDMFEFDVAVGNSAQVKDGMLKWSAIGTGATYVVTINGQEYQSLSIPSFPLSEVGWNVGDNVAAVTAKENGKEVLMESATIKKLASPTLTIAGNNWTTDENEYNRYKIKDSGNAGDWENTLKSTSEFTAGEYTIYAKRIVSSPTAFEVESDEVSVTLHKLDKPVISMANHQVAAAFDSEKYTLNLEYSQNEDDGYTAITSLGEIRTAGTYWVRARLAAIGGKEEGFDIVLPSEVSNPTSVIKLAAPSKISYKEGELQVKAKDESDRDVENVKYYYVVDGEERELTGGSIANLPQGIFEIYGRRIAQADNELDSENTPENGWAHVFNMNITLTISKVTNSQSQIYVVFGGCSEIDSITFSYSFEAFDREGNSIGTTQQREITFQKGSSGNPDNIVRTLNYRSDFDSDKQKDIYEIVLTVELKSGDNRQQIVTPKLKVV